MRTQPCSGAWLCATPARIVELSTIDFLRILEAEQRIQSAEQEFGLRPGWDGFHRGSRSWARRTAPRGTPIQAFVL